MWTGSPPPAGERLDGMVSGLNELFAWLGNGTDDNWLIGPDGPSMPCDSSSKGRPLTTRQINNP